MVSDVPVVLNPWNFIAVAAATIVLCLLAAMLPGLAGSAALAVEVIPL